MRQARRLGWLTLVIAVLASSCRTLAPSPSPAPQVNATRVTDAFTPPPAATQADANQLQSDFAAAAKEFSVPVSILLSVSYNESRWETHDGKPSTDGGYGPMHLTDVAPSLPARADNSSGAVTNPTNLNDPSLHTLIAASRLIDKTPDTLKTDPAQNIRGGAALLAKYAHDTVGTIPTTVADWYGAVAMYSGSKDASVATDFADTVFATIQQGMSRITTAGQLVTLPATSVTPNKQTAEFLHAATPVPTSTGDFPADCPSDLTCNVIPAGFVITDPAKVSGHGNYNLANRPTDGLDIRYIVIHDTETTYDDSLKVFLDPKENLSANYMIRSSDGLVTQFVQNKDIAHHAGNWYINTHSIGIEHEGFAMQGATWYNEQLYQTSAKLVRYLAAKYHVPLDRAHIVGHDNVPSMTGSGQASMHWDPGPYWDWAHYLDLLGAPISGSDAKNGNVVVINPKFQNNTPSVSTCDGGKCKDLPPQPSNFVYLRTAPSADAPLIADPAMKKLQTTPGQGTTLGYDWGDKAVAGEKFYRVGSQGDWDAIYFGGQKAWFYNPNHTTNAVPTTGTLITPKAGKSSITVYGYALPEASVFPPGMPLMPFNPLEYSIPAGQIYVATDLVTSDYYPTSPTNADEGAHDLLRGHIKYYQISFNHRFAFVRADDVDVVSAH